MSSLTDIYVLLRVMSREVQRSNASPKSALEVLLISFTNLGVAISLTMEQNRIQWLYICIGRAKGLKKIFL